MYKKKINMINWLPAKNRQQGMSLLTTLVVMGLLMILGVTAMRLSKSQLNLSANLQFQSAAFNETESVVATAERWLATGANYKSAAFTTYASGSGLYPINYLASNSIDPLTMTWSNTNSVQGSNANQRYLIEQLAENKTLLPSGNSLGGRVSAGCNKVNVYRVIGRGESNRGALKFVQTVYSVLSC